MGAGCRSHRGWVHLRSGIGLPLRPVWGGRAVIALVGRKFDASPVATAHGLGRARWWSRGGIEHVETLHDEPSYFRCRVVLGRVCRCEFLAMAAERAEPAGAHHSPAPQFEHVAEATHAGRGQRARNAPRQKRKPANARTAITNIASATPERRSTAQTTPMPRTNCNSMFRGRDTSLSDRQHRAQPTRDRREP